MLFVLPTFPSVVVTSNLKVRKQTTFNVQYLSPLPTWYLFTHCSLSADAQNKTPDMKCWFTEQDTCG